MCVSDRAQRRDQAVLVSENHGRVISSVMACSGPQCRRLALLHVAAATRVETVVRRALALKTFQAVSYVALRLQTRGRGRRGRLVAVNRRRALAAVRLQTKLRARAARVAYAAIQKGAILLQSVVRRAMATRRLVRWCRARVARRRFATLVATAARLQHSWRGALWRRCFVGLRAATITTQTAARRVHFLKRYGAYRVHAVRVQTVWRGALSALGHAT